MYSFVQKQNYRSLQDQFVKNLFFAWFKTLNSHTIFLQPRSQNLNQDYPTWEKQCWFHEPFQNLKNSSNYFLDATLPKGGNQTNLLDYISISDCQNSDLSLIFHFPTANLTHYEDLNHGITSQPPHASSFTYAFLVCRSPGMIVKKFFN